MVITAQDLRAAGIEIPLFVGGAALTRKFTATRIAAEYGGPTLYAKDAMDGLDLANRLFGATTRDALVERLRAEQEALRAGADAGAARGGARARGRAEPLGRSRATAPVPTPPDLEPHLLRNVPLTHVFPYLNLQMLLGSIWGEGLGGAAPRAGRPQDRRDQRGGRAARARGGRAGAAPGRTASTGSTRRGPRATTSCSPTRARRPRASTSRARPSGERLCLSDYVREHGGGEKDYVALFAVTCGAGVRDLAERWKEEGHYLRSHALQALAIETAEAFAEMLHARLRTQWGFPDPPGLALQTS